LDQNHYTFSDTLSVPFPTFSSFAAIHGYLAELYKLYHYSSSANSFISSLIVTSLSEYILQKGSSTTDFKRIFVKNREKKYSFMTNV
jgi:hypothetical protein